MSAIRIALVDDHIVVRTGLKTYLETQPDFIVVAEAERGDQALDLVQQSRPDVVLMDISMPGLDGLEATRRIRAACPECRVLALTVHEDRQYFIEMLLAGASGYVTKRSAADELTAAIRAVASGSVYLQPALARWLLEDYRRLQRRCEAGAPPPAGESAAPDLGALSRREAQVLELVAQGFSSAQIGEKLGISPKTAARHRERIMNKLNLHSAAELVRFAIRSGLIGA